MRSLGLSGVPLRVVDAGQEPKLRAGVSIFLEVKGEVAPGLWRVSGAGGSYLARSDLPLEPGAVLRARVEKGAAGLLFRLETEAAGATPQPEVAARFDAVLTRLGLVPDRLGREAVAALLAEGLKPEAEALLRLRKSASASAGAAAAAGSGTEERRLRLAAMLEAKGLASSADTVDLLADLLDGGSDWPGDARDGGGNGSDRREGGDRLPEAPREDRPFDRGPEAGPQATTPHEELVPAGELPARLGRFLSDLARKGDESSGEEAGAAIALLRLFNHARSAAAASDWVVLPFRFSLDRVAFAGSLGILLPYVAGGPGRIEARFRAGMEGLPEDASASVPWSFTLRFGAGAPRLVMGTAPVQGGADALLAPLRAFLEGTGCAIESGGDGGPRRDGSFDLEA